MIGVIADDVTGATDVAAALSREGLQTLLAFNAETSVTEDADAIVIGLKTRSIPVAEAVATSLVALRSLENAGATRFYFKYCSTFDSTDEGNIGPVTEALAEALGVSTVVTTPAAPIHGRTVNDGNLYVFDVPLHETHMAHHPITPMRDSNLARLLTPQSRGAVMTLPLSAARDGAVAVRATIAAAESAGVTQGSVSVTQVIADAVTAADLAIIAEATDDAVLTAGSAGLIGAIAERQAASGRTVSAPPAGRTAIIAGSCSRRTLEQIAAFESSGGLSHRVVAAPGQTAAQLAEAALTWWDEQPTDTSAMIYSSSSAEERNDELPEAGELYEQVAGIVANGLAHRGVQRMLVAGGETSGAVIRELGTTVAVVGDEAAVGAPWIHDVAGGVHLVLKSGNFGEVDMFTSLAGGASHD
ncbi:four-carbon acid sugar kinase family protein [Microbacterium mitrae]|uniref:3-oxo-tetronate kinase n=1 Tax=Microbacterium mitrae TaxID=664640 RepID=A0A5C8HJL8_9MICO|nr:3-oxo-tetronate kinase [Microbacterium mitrae]TXK02688.1 four-carbon acid sugar kinase family protein [Microbacterium mitrae]